MKTQNEGVALRGGDSGADRETAPPDLLKCTETGQHYFMSNGWKQYVTPLRLRYATPGVTAQRLTGMIRWDFVRNEPIDEADARDAQCRAGWSDVGYGFFAFKCTEKDGQYAASWVSSVSCE